MSVSKLQLLSCGTLCCGALEAGRMLKRTGLIATLWLALCKHKPQLVCRALSVLCVCVTPLTWLMWCSQRRFQKQCEEEVNGEAESLSRSVEPVLQTGHFVRTLRCNCKTFKAFTQSGCHLSWTPWTLELFALLQSHRTTAPA